MPADPWRRGSPDTTDEYRTCPKCGCPHKTVDTVCSYCGSPLTRKTPLSERLRRAVETVKWRRRLKSHKRAKVSSGKLTSKLVTLALGVILTLLGGWFFIQAVSSSSFSEFLIGSLFLIYGIYSSAYTLRDK